FTLQTSMRLISFSPVLTGAACFAQPTAGRIGSRLIMACLRFMKALYLSRMVTFSSELTLSAELDFVGGAGGVYRCSDYGDSWVEINHDIIQTDVPALATNPSGHIFAGT